MRRLFRAGLGIGILGLSLVAVELSLGLPDVLAPLWQGPWRAEPGQHTVLFVVMDTVRADHTSLCGYERPTTPVLQGMADSSSGVAHCSTYAPGAWTLPSHGSFFTGLPVPEHGAHFVTVEEGGEVDPAGFQMRPLRPEANTLAERFTERGVQAVSVSESPALRHALGLDQGFGVNRVLDAGEDVLEVVTATLRHRVDRDAPLFLFVNLMDAHEPWAGIPAGVDWVPARRGHDWGAPLPTLSERMSGTEPPYHLLKDVLLEREPSEVLEPRLAHVTDVYDYGVYQADQAVGSIVAHLRDEGWADDGLRVVVTSDHGELLGEHGLVEHGRSLLEPVARVPLVVWDSDGPPSLPEGPLSGLVVHDLVMEGTVPDPLPEPVAHNFPDTLWQEHFDLAHETRVATWGGTEKLTWLDGSVHGIDLQDDPREQHPAAVPEDHWLVERLQVGLSQLAGAEVQGDRVGEDVNDALRALGYIE